MSRKEYLDIGDKVIDEILEESTEEEKEEIVSRKHIILKNVLATCKVANGDVLYSMLGERIENCHSIQELIDNLEVKYSMKLIPVTIRVHSDNIGINVLYKIPGNLSINEENIDFKIDVSGNILIQYTNKADETVIIPSTISIGNLYYSVIIVDCTIEKDLPFKPILVI